MTSTTHLPEHYTDTEPSINQITLTSLSSLIFVFDSHEQNTLEPHFDLKVAEALLYKRVSYLVQTLLVLLLLLGYLYW